MDGNVLVQPDLGPLGHTSALLRFGGNRHERHTFVGEEGGRGCSDPVGVRNSSFIPRLGPSEDREPLLGFLGLCPASVT